MRSFAKSGAVDEIRAEGGEVFAVTSEPQSLATEAKEAWELPFETVGDPHHEVLQVCRDRGWLDLFIVQTPGILRDRPWASHPLGHFQAGTLAVTQDRRVLYRWRCRPTHQNKGGATGRAKPEYVWRRIQENLGATGDASLDLDAELDIADGPWPLFVAALFAHGWFVRPRRFPLSRPGDRQSKKTSEMKPRLIGFAIAWLLAFVLLPVRWVLAALVTYAAAITPAVRRINREFQHIGDPHAQPFQRK